MSFILEALKKSENKRRRKSGQASPSILDLSPRKNDRSRSWIVGVLLLLLINAVILVWFFGSWEQPVEQPQEIAPVVTSSTQADLPKKDNAPIVVEQKQATIKALPLPRNEKKIYHFEQLPVTIQGQIPSLKMSLHAYNRDDATASLVQLNDQILREGDSVTDQIRLELITADGAVLRYDGYRFLLPRRGGQK